jgi:sulfur carrier protein ThiS
MDYNKYIGLPYESNGRTESGVDCWGLACLFYRDELGIELPSYSELYSTASDPQVVQAINANRDNWLQTTEAVPGDLCLFNIYGEPAHVGVYVGDNHFLHAREGRDSVIESLSSSQWSKRFQGFYTHSRQAQVLAAGSPHPLKTQVVYDWTVAGTTVQDFANFVNTKYSVSERFAAQLAILVDGVVIPRAQWSTTVLQAGQTVAYKSVAQGNAGRMLLMLVVVVVATWIAGPSGFNLGAQVGASLGIGAAAGTALVVAGINMAGMALINAIAPVRMPGQQPDPGSANSLNLFSGASNQPNRFGAIPVVLGKMRVTGVLGATPYIDTLTDTSLINLLLVWGFGPLQISDICVGSSSIENFYGLEEFGQDFPAPVTLSGFPTDDATAFNKLYPRDVEQQQVGVLLVNNTEDGNPWKNVVLNQLNTTSIDVALTFPEGMRQLVISGEEAGQVREATASVEFQLRKFNATTNQFSAWVARPTYDLNTSQTATQGGALVTGYSDTIPPNIGYNITGFETSTFSPLYQWFTYALSETGEIRRFDGAATDNQNSDPSSSLVAMYASNSYNSLLGNDADADTYTRLPQLPQNGYVKLHTICVFNNQVVSSINHVQNYSGRTGLELTTTELTTVNYEYGNTAAGIQVKISNGKVSAISATQPSTGVDRVIFDTRNMPGVVNVANNKAWGTFTNAHAVWDAAAPTAPTFEKTQQVTFEYTGYYKVEASADDEGSIYIDNRLVAGIPYPGFRTTVSNLVYLEAGTYPVKVKASNPPGRFDAGVACEITYTENGGLNNLPTPDTVIVFGSPGMYYKRKDAFNFVYKIKNLDPGQYEIRVRRTNDDVSEPQPDLRNFNKVSLLSVTAYASALDAAGNPQGPLNKIPNTYLARTALRLQSTSKANGSIDGVNAVVQTIALDWNRTTQTWIMRPTSNPASLFAYVLTHPGNAYRIKMSEASQQIDLAGLQTWHEYCSDNQFEFNSVVTQTQSVMDILRDICAAGKASPTYIDGKWSVIVDKPRAYTTQHFTPHNSWGFEATKILPRLPDAFRITFANAEKAYQADEVIVCNFGKTQQTAEIFEELSLPGVTNATQARRLARWHLAQTKLRPETYTLNADFEYLVCGRGDLVRVSHDIPLWGTGSGRVAAKTGSVLGLTEQVYLEVGKTYQIRIRLNTISVTPNSDSALLTLAPITTSNWYNSVTLTAAVPASVEVDNLYMIGELAKESQQLVVLGVEPSSNLSARLTLADYSPEIYSINLDSEAELPSFNPNITGSSTSTVQNTITQAPLITGANSGSSLAEEIATGTFQNVLLVSFANVTGLTAQAQKIQVQVVLGDQEFDSANLFGVYTVDKSAASLSLTGLKTLTIYKIRARYTNAAGSVSGPWSEIFYTTSTGKTDNEYTVQSLVVQLDDVFITAVPATVLNKPTDFKTFEYRLYKDTGNEDFWELDPATNGILVIQTSDTARFSLLNVPQPRISTAGVTYRVACRALDNNNNYSAQSALGTIVIATIK